jgi:hypothetical protein
MTSTKVTLSPADVARLAPGHDARGGKAENWDLAEAFAGAGALRSNVEDMLTFLASNLTPPGGSTLGRAIRVAQAPHFTAENGRRGGLGWGLSTLVRARTILTHAGGTAGYHTFVAIDPEPRRAVVVLSNQVPFVTRLGLHLLEPQVAVSLAPLGDAFRVLSVTMALLLVSGVFAAWRRTGASGRRATFVAAGVALGLTAWMSATYAAALSGMLHFPPRPPTMMVVLILTVVLAVGLAVSPIGRRLATGLPLSLLIGVHGYRLPLELMMHRAYEQGLMPVQMSYRGLNYDIVTGITAIVAALLLATGRAGIATARAWTAVGTLLLVNIIAIALLSAPTPWRMFRQEPANDWITTAPYVWLPSVLVAFAIGGHIVILRRLRAERARAG